MSDKKLRGQCEHVYQIGTTQYYCIEGKGHSGAHVYGDDSKSVREILAAENTALEAHLTALRAVLHMDAGADGAKVVERVRAVVEALKEYANHNNWADEFSIVYETGVVDVNGNPQEREFTHEIGEPIVWSPERNDCNNGYDLAERALAALHGAP